MRHHAGLLVCMLLAAPLGGCGQAFTSLGEWTGSTVDSLATRRIHDDPIAIDVVGPVAIDVELFNGSVTVEADETLEQALVTITRRATHGYRRTKEAEISLEEIDTSVAIVPGELGQAIEVRATTWHAEPHFQRADVHIQVPAVEGLRVRTQNGHVTAENIQGHVDVVTNDGNVRIMTNLPMVQPVSVINTAGDIDFRVRAESPGAWDCEALRGHVLHHVDYGRIVVHQGTTEQRLIATFNDGSNPVLLRTADGDIRIAVVAAPTHVGQFIFD